VPALVDIKEDSWVDDDNDNDSHASSGSHRTLLASTTTDLSFLPTPVPISVTTPQRPAEDETPPAVEVATPSSSTTTTSSSPHLESLEEESVDNLQVKFDPRIWIREFNRTPEEADRTWYNNNDMDDFKSLALDRILRYQSTTEILATGTGPTIQRTLPAWNGPIYSHAALTLDGENDDDTFMREKVLEKELRSILIVDPQKLCLKLFSKAFKNALPRSARITSVTSSREVLKLVGEGFRFDLLVVEERLRLFHRHGSSTSSASSPCVSDGPEASNPHLDGRASSGSGNSSSAHSSGAALINVLSKTPVTSTSLFIGVSAHVKEDEPKLSKSGADFCWTKPPPPIDRNLVEILAKAILIKRGRAVLATELFE